MKNKNKVREVKECENCKHEFRMKILVNGCLNCDPPNSPTGWMPKGEEDDENNEGQATYAYRIDSIRRELRQVEFIIEEFRK